MRFEATLLLLLAISGALAGTFDENKDGVDDRSDRNRDGKPDHGYSGYRYGYDGYAYPYNAEFGHPYGYARRFFDGYGYGDNGYGRLGYGVPHYEGGYYGY